MCALALSLLLTLPAVARVPAPTAPVLTRDSEERWIPFDLTPANQIRFTALVAGRPVAAILDTGASHSMLTRDFADRTGAKVVRRGSVVAVGGRVPLGWTNAGAVSFGGLLRIAAGMYVVELPLHVTGASVDLIVGRDLIDRVGIDLDSAGRRFRILPSGRMPFTGTRLPLTLGSAPYAFVTELSIAGRKLRPIMIDTGDGTALTLARASWHSIPIAPPPMRIETAHGAGGPESAEVTTLDEVLLGKSVARAVDVRVERTGGFSDRSRSAGRIGLGLLQRYRVLIDPAAGHMILADPEGSRP